MFPTKLLMKKFKQLDSRLADCMNNDGSVINEIRNRWSVSNNKSNLASWRMKDYFFVRPYKFNEAWYGAQRMSNFLYFRT